jgi:TetR/AcrR family transcriptional repressor of uid operon
MSARRVLSPPRPGVPKPTRGRILAAAERLFAEQGYRRVSMPMIAKASGITAGAIYKHFDSKEDLFFEAVAQRSVQAVQIGTEATSDAVADLARIVAAYTTHRQKLLRQLAVEIHSASIHNSRVRRLLARSLDHNIAQIRETITGAQRTGRIDPAADSEMLARAVIVFVMGLMHMETLLPRFVGDPDWHDFVQARVAILLGVRDPPPGA